MIVLLRGNIVHENVDAIVNAANSSLLGGGGVDGAIHRAAGPALLEECRAIVAKIGRLDTGKAVITRAGKLAARHVIHTVGPVYYGGAKGEPALLASAYRESMRIAAAAGVKTISFPSISTGVFGYPVEEAAPIALKTVQQEIVSLGEPSEARFVLFDARTFDAYAAAAEEHLPAGMWQKLSS